MESGSVQNYRFDGAIVDARRMMILREDGVETQLRSKTFRVLQYFLDNMGRDISKDELISSVWLDNAVVDDVVVQSIKDLRRALGDDARNSRFIRTIPKFGYRFVATPLADGAQRRDLVPSRAKASWRPILAVISLLILVLILSTSFTPRLAKKGATESGLITNVLTPNLEAYRYYSLGVEKAQSLHNQDAIELFERAIELDPEFAMAYARIGYAYAVTWDLGERGKPFLEKAFQLNNRLTEKDRLQIAGWYSIANMEYSAAIDIYRELINRDPLDAESRYQLARLLRGENLMNEAIEITEKGLEIDPTSKKLYNQLGGLYSAVGSHAKAIAAHKRLVELSGEEPNAYDSLGLSYQWSGDYAAAADNYIKAISLKPDFEVANIHLANTRFQTGRYAEAIKLFERYIKTAPSDVEKMRGYDALVSIYTRKGNFGAAERAAFHLHEVRSDWPYAVDIVRLEQAKANGKADFNVPDFVKIKNAGRGGNNSDRTNLYYQGYFELKKGNLESALESFRQSLKFAPQIWNADPFEDCLANAYLEIGQFENAIAEYQRILRLNPNYPLASYRIARAFEAKNDLDNAKPYYKRFLDTWAEADVDVAEVVDARRRLTGS